MTEFFNETGVIRSEILLRNFLGGVLFCFNFFVFLGRALIMLLRDSASRMAGNIGTMAGGAMTAGWNALNQIKDNYS